MLDVDDHLKLTDDISLAIAADIAIQCEVKVLNVPLDPFDNIASGFPRLVKTHCDRYCVSFRQGIGEFKDFRPHSFLRPLATPQQRLRQVRVLG